MKTIRIITNRKAYLEAIVKVYGNQPIDYLTTLRDGLNILINEKLCDYGYINRIKEDSYFSERNKIVYHKNFMML